ncbi:hypothetical protein [Streptomyces cellulosae]|uniref:hypothetical protein n=1 Tax=Streptomyces cellulosae TaxID=1968 RepID=UPI000A4D599F|nr:hypothetical protein [Streptomyces cellulosae]
MTRTAAGRRALRVALLVGGLFALGVLCGGQAQAADGMGSAPVTAVSGVVARVAHTPAAVKAEPETDAGVEAQAVTAEPVVPKPTAPEPTVPESTVPESTVPEPTVPKSTVPEPLADVTAKLPSLPVSVPGSSSPGLPALPGLPDTPSLPKLWNLPGFPTVPSEPTVPSAPSVPTLPGLPELPGLPTLPVPTLPIQVTPVPRPSSPSAPATPPSAAGDRGGRTVDGRSDTGTPLAYGPWFGTGGTWTHAVGHTPGHRAERSGYVPEHPPIQYPGGALGGKSGLDNNSARHGGDPHAVTVDHRAPLRLVPGAAAGVDADGLRDRHRDIPVSPA